jgi:hypothetical protein
MNDYKQSGNRRPRLFVAPGFHCGEYTIYACVRSGCEQDYPLRRSCVGDGSQHLIAHERKSCARVSQFFQERRAALFALKLFRVKSILNNQSRGCGLFGETQPL